MKIKVVANQSIVDVALLHYGGAEGLSSLLRDNPSLTINEVLTPGQELYINEINIIQPVEIQPVAKAQVKVKEDKIVLDSQNIVDLAIQYYGDAEGVKHLLNDNPELSIDTMPAKGSDLIIRKEAIINKGVVQMIHNKSLIIATGKWITRPDGYWITEDNENVVDENGNRVNA